MLSAKSIKPGQSGQIEASVKTEGVAGKINKTITVVSNDPRQPQVQLTITALVEQEFPLSDQSLYFGAVPKGKEVVKELTITIPPGKKILSVESTDQNVTVKLVPGAVVSRFRDRMNNIHPALLPDFGGAGMYGHRVHAAVLASGATESGVTVHLVDEVFDRGEILAQEKVPVLPEDTPESLAARVLEAEHRLLPRVVLDLARRIT